MIHNTRFPVNKLAKSKPKLVEMTIPLACAHEKTVSTNRQPAGPGINSDRTFRCIVCSAAFKTKSEFEQHAKQHHRTEKGRLPKRYPALNPAKISDHSSLRNIQNKLIRNRYNHSVLSSGRSTRSFLSVCEHPTHIKQNGVFMATTDHEATIATTALANQSDKIQKKLYCAICKCSYEFDGLHVCIRLPQHRPKKRKINAVDVEYDRHGIEKACVESSQQAKSKLDIEPIVVPSHYCRFCHVPHLSREAYRDHLEAQHHVRFPLSPLDFTHRIRKRNPPAVTRSTQSPQKIPNQINISSLMQGQIRNANIEPDIDDPNYHCNSCHITKPNRTSYLFHLCMVHKMTRTKGAEQSLKRMK